MLLGMEPEIDRVAAAQHNLITTDQLTAAGLSNEQIYRWVERGLLTRIRPNIYRTLGGRQTWEQAVLAACLAAGEPAVASHRTAARLWGTPFFERDGIHLLTSAARPKLP